MSHQTNFSYLDSPKQHTAFIQYATQTNIHTLVNLKNSVIYQLFNFSFVLLFLAYTTALFNHCQFQGISPFFLRKGNAALFCQGLVIALTILQPYILFTLKRSFVVSVNDLKIFCSLPWPNVWMFTRTNVYSMLFFISAPVHQYTSGFFSQHFKMM